MKKFALCLVLIISFLPTAMMAEDDSKYLVGAVPEVDGKVVFTKEFDLAGIDQSSIYEHIHNWLDNHMKAIGNGSRIVYAEKEKGEIVATVEEYIVFNSGGFFLDRAMINYNLVIYCKPGKCEVQIDRIRYQYEDKRYTAEAYISDKVALNRNKTAVIRGYRKFRISTVDYVNDMFDKVRIAFGIQGKEEPTSLIQSMQSGSIARVSTSSSADEPSTLQGYRQLEPDKIPGNIIKMVNDDWMLITAGTDEKFNMMTASWGGIGVLYGKPVAICFINPLRYTYQLMETNDTYTLTFYTEAHREALRYCGSNSGRDTDKVKGSGLTPVTTPLGSKAFSEAWLVIECRKLVGQSLSHDALFDEKIKSEWEGKELHRMYIGEIINVWMK